MMILGIVVLVVLIFMGLLIIASRKPLLKTGTGPGSVYIKKPLTPVEQVLYYRLVKTLPDFVILAQVQYSRFLGVRGKHHLSLSNSIRQKSADFLVCARDMLVLAVVELDDASHARQSRRISDAKKEAVLKAAGIRLIRWQAKTMPDEITIRQTFVPVPEPAMQRAVSARLV